MYTLFSATLGRVLFQKTKVLVRELKQVTAKAEKLYPIPDEERSKIFKHIEDIRNVLNYIEASLHSRKLS